jgi:hypothetical protein
MEDHEEEGIGKGGACKYMKRKNENGTWDEFQNGKNTPTPPLFS